MTEQGKQKNRDLFPFAAAKLDELRAIFGEDTRIVYAEQDGIKVGKWGPVGVRPNVERWTEK